MIVKVADITPEGMNLEFEPSHTGLNARVAAGNSDGPDAPLQQAYQFLPNTNANLRLEVEGSTVIVRGNAHARCLTICSRCAEEVEKDLDVTINFILKPRPERGPVEAQDEDLHFGFYDDKEINCGAIVEEFLVLGIPYIVLCRPDCRGLCVKCGQNLNSGACGCEDDRIGDERFAVLRGLKIQ